MTNKFRMTILHLFYMRQLSSCKYYTHFTTSLSNSTEKENILMFACLFLVMKCFPHCQHVAASFCFVHLKHNWMSVSLRTSPRIQEAHFTHPCFGFGLTPQQRSKYNTQNPPQSSATRTTQQLTVINKINSPTTTQKWTDKNVCLDKIK